MALPEHEVAALQPVEPRRQGGAERPLLLVGVARAGPPRILQAELHEARAIEAEAGAPAPEIGRPDEPLGGGGEIRFGGPERDGMAGKDEAAPREPPVLALARLRREGRAEAQMGEMRPLQVGRRVDEGAQGGDPMGRCRIGGPERLSRQVADIAVAGELNPGEAVAGLIDRHRVAHHRLGVEPGIRARRAAQGGGGQDDPRRLAFDVALGRDDALQADVGEVGPGRGEAGIKGVWHRGAVPDAGSGRDSGWMVFSHGRISAGTDRSRSRAPLCCAAATF
ncbi:hypothetical protein CHKEEEPN_2084 [Methylorubrum podarium]|nr:hypothetical protein CHKEEEPN_2084 [Methylorubrum podarium]